MKTQITLFLTIFILCLTSCEKDDDQESNYAIGLYLPMKLGNYWKINNSNYKEIIDTVRINGDLFYKFYELTGGDAFTNRYLRIDENGNLIEKYPKYPETTYTHAKFNSKVGEKFWTLGDRSVNDCLVVNTYKKEGIIKFEFDPVNHSKLKGSKNIESYKIGLGFVGNWKEVKIDNTIYNF
jgi:hypothetical protein